MSYKNQNEGTPYAVHLKLSSDTSVSSGSAVPYALVSGTTGHGVTVSSGVVSLPAGEWLCNFTLECTTRSQYTADLYVNSTINTDFPSIEALDPSIDSYLESTSIPLSGACTVELRPNSTQTFSEMSDIFIFGVKT